MGVGLFGLVVFSGLLWIVGQMGRSAR